uniref:prefoldin subunit 5 n=1 Tax=Osmia lignaria TaxID=473952 RepID=UPI0014792CB7|nr:prefoldin subunit 5 [Osmia lignaria]XP_034184078.1 prefoldin subunit 5 [Osmia lignaria]XP_034184079.1 prefoldin subunit 5 [Osmia lignaria]
MSEVSMSEAPHLQQIDLTTLNLQQLTSLKQQLDLDLGIFQDSLQTLKIAQTKFQESGSCLEKITPAMEGNEVLVPLTGSMYVVGKLADTSNVLFDIGTGYYIQKNVSDAKEYFERRVSYITTQLENIQQLGLEKSKIRDAVVDTIEMKLQN